MATFKTEQEIYDDVKDYVTGQLGELTNWSAGSAENALARLVGFALSMAWKTLYILYRNIWATTADRAGLKNWLEVFDVTWGGQTEAEARKQTLAKFREGGVGTAAWYESTAKTEFPEVTEAYLFAGRRGVNTADLLVLHRGQDVLENTVAALQNHFNNVELKIGTIDLRVITRRDVEADIRAVEADA
jgi:hypothetical protein